MPLDHEGAAGVLYLRTGTARHTERRQVSAEVEPAGRLCGAQSVSHTSSRGDPSALFACSG